MLVVVSRLNNELINIAIDLSLATLAFEQPLCLIIATNLDSFFTNATLNAVDRLKLLSDMGLNAVYITQTSGITLTLPIQSIPITPQEYRHLISQHPHAICL